MGNMTKGVIFINTYASSRRCLDWGTPLCLLPGIDKKLKCNLIGIDRMVKPRIGIELKGVDAQIAASRESLGESWAGEEMAAVLGLLWGSHLLPFQSSQSRWLRRAGNSLTIAGQFLRNKFKEGVANKTAKHLAVFFIAMSLNAVPEFYFQLATFIMNEKSLFYIFFPDPFP